MNLDTPAGEGAMRFGSLFSGVGGMDMGFEAAGMAPTFMCEIDPRCRMVLRRHWPDVPCHDDITTLDGATLPEVDLIAWGSPCQDLSVAGNRAGMAGERSGLFHEGMRIIREMRGATDGRSPAWSVWENVEGALSSNQGRDFGVVLDSLGEAGAVVVEWAVLDGQFFGPPQRRRRVFVVACFDPARQCPDPLLPVGTGSTGDSATRGEAGEDAATGTSGRVAAFSQNQRGEVVLSEYAHALGIGGGKPGEGYPAVLIERERERESGERVDGQDRGTGRQRRAGWAPDRAAPILSHQQGGYRNDVDGGTWIVEPS